MDHIPYSILTFLKLHWPKMSLKSNTKRLQLLQLIRLSIIVIIFNTYQLPRCNNMVHSSISIYHNLGKIDILTYTKYCNGVLDCDLFIIFILYYFF